MDVEIRVPVVMTTDVQVAMVTVLLVPSALNCDDTTQQQNCRTIFHFYIHCERERCNYVLRRSLNKIKLQKYFISQIILHVKSRPATFLFMFGCFIVFFIYFCVYTSNFKFIVLFIHILGDSSNIKRTVGVN